MTKRTTRNKIRFQLEEAHNDLIRAQKHLAQTAALADDKSGDIDEHLPGIILSAEMLTEAIKQFRERC